MRRRSVIPTATRALTLLAIVLLAASRSSADEVAAFLERHGLQQLLAIHLEHQLDTASQEQREQIVLRLASLYSTLLEQTEDPATRETLVQRSRRLLAAAPDEAVDELRLALLRGAYRNAERTAENHRLRLASSDDLNAAGDTLDDVLPKLLQLEQRLEQRLQRIDRRLSRAAGSEAVMLADEVDDVRQLLARTTFLRGWALYYQSWLNERRENAKVAERLFAGLLEPDRAYLEPDEVSEDLRGVESLARCILGMALCKSLTASTATALAWIELLRDDETYEPLRAQVPAWEMAIHLENGGYRQAREILERTRRDDDEVPLAWLRLAAVHGLEAADPSRDARELVDMAITDLAGRGELDQILDLAERYGAEALGNSGFALRYVRGLMAYHEARQLHGGDDAVVPPDVAAAYQSAVDALRGALAETDAPNYPDAAAESRRLVAWCLYFQGRFLEARAAFEEAAAGLDGEAAADALWMAIVCLDKVVGGDRGTVALRQQLNTLISGFLDAYPASPHAPKLVLKRAVGEDPPTEQTLEQLLSIPPGSEVHDQARRQAADMLYRMFRAAEVQARKVIGERYLEIALPLVREEVERLADLPRRGQLRFVVRGRRALEVALDDDVQRPDAARVVFDALAAGAATGLIDVDEHRDELEYRRVRLALLVDDFVGASNVADVMRAEMPDSPWTRTAMRALFSVGFDRWRAIRDGGGDDRLAIDAVVRYGQAVIDEMTGDGSRPIDDAATGVAVAVADAAMQIWERSRDEDRGRQALGLYEQLLEIAPANAQFLRAAAVLAGHFGDDDAALERWRRLNAGAPIGSEIWYEAKFNLIDLLSRDDPQRARAVLDQHKQLNPDYGPEPWGGRLKGLDRRLPPPASPPSGDGEPAGGGGS